jgi:glycosyltransferase involved in cell wall biosynthesis
MKVCIISDFAKTGGASTAADRIAHSFFENGCEVHRISSDGCVNSPFKEYVLDVSRKFQLLSMFSSNSIISSFLPKLRKKDLHAQLGKILSAIKPDWINLHNFHGADWPMELAELSLSHSPTSWTLHDCSTFLGSYYPSYCPEASSTKAKELEQFWSRLQKNKSSKLFSFIAPSNWMERSAKQSYWSKFNSSVVPYPIFKGFSPHIAPQACKQALGIAPSKTVILSSAGNLDEPRKGGQILQDIIFDNKFKESQFILMGEFKMENNLPENVHTLGFIKDDKLKKLAYCAADLTLHPAPIDNLPNVVIESISCHTPVLGFSTGGLPDMVIPNKTGWLVDEISATALSQKLEELTKLRAFESNDFTFSFTRDEMFNSNKIFNQYLGHYHALIK